MTSANMLKDWMPIRLYDNGTGTLVDWCYMGGHRFTQPFFADTIWQRMREPFNLVFRHQTSVDLLADVHQNSDEISPTGFIYHMSRCGSTLVAQMLATLSSNIVISEAAPIDTAITMEIKNRPTPVGELLRDTIAAFGRRRYPDERHYFIKLDSWNTLDLDLIMSAYPEVPWIFLYRDPIEVIVSQMRQRGSQMVPGVIDRILPDLPIDIAMQAPPEEYCAHVLAAICSAALRHASAKTALLVNYNQLPEAVTGIIAGHFGLSFTPAELERMRQATRFNSKTPQMYFEPDSTRKRDEATEAIQRAAERRLTPLYMQLENARAAQQSAS